MSSKLFRLLAFVALILCMTVSEGFAASQPMHKLNYFQTSTIQKDGQDVLLIEIGMNKDGLEYDVLVKPYMQNRLIINLQHTSPGKIDRDISLKSDLAKRVKIQEVETGRTQISIDLAHAAVEGTSYNVYTLPEDRKAKKPYRLVIEVMPSAAVADDKVEGVKGHAIVLDPGHGGSDSGAIGPDGVTEKEVTLAVSKKVQALLQAGGGRVIMTRETDRDVYGINATDTQELQARVNVALYAPESEIFVSIHCNAFSNPAAHGMETYYYDGSYRGQRLATLLNEELAAEGGLFNRGVKTANFYVIKHTNVPASLIELGFITNYQEEHLLMDDAYQDKLALAVAKAIGRYFQE